MKQLKIFLMLCIASVAMSRSMGTEPVSLWYFLPKETITQIVAHADVTVKQDLVLVNKQLLDIASKNNIKDMLFHFPCLLRRQDHLDYMVKYAKEDNKAMVLRLMKIATYCDHADWLDVIPYFLPHDAPELGLFEWDKDYGNWSERLFSCIIKAYAGDAEMITQYKINHDALVFPGDFQLFPKNRDEVTALHLAVYHPVAIAQLLLSQDPRLINVKDQTSLRSTPIVWAVRRKAVDVCKFLLSCKNLDLTQDQGVILVRLPDERCSALYEACLHGSFEIVKLLIDYHKKYTIADINSDYVLCRAAITGRNKDIVSFLLDSACLEEYHILQLIKKACYASTPEIMNLLLERFSNQINNVSPDVSFYWFNMACDRAQIDNARILLARFAFDINTIQDRMFTSYATEEQRTIGNITVLYLAAMRGEVEMVKFLLDNGADSDIANSEGEKPIDVTLKNSIKELLLPTMKHVTLAQRRDEKPL